MFCLSNSRLLIVLNFGEAAQFRSSRLPTIPVGNFTLPLVWICLCPDFFSNRMSEFIHSMISSFLKLIPISYATQFSFPISMLLIRDFPAGQAHMAEERAGYLPSALLSNFTGSHFPRLLLTFQSYLSCPLSAIKYASCSSFVRLSKYGSHCSMLIVLSASNISANLSLLTAIPPPLCLLIIPMALCPLCHRSHLSL